MNVRIRHKNKGLEIRRLIQRIGSKIDIIPFITMKYLSDKQEKNQDNLTEFQEEYGFTFRDYELLSNIIKKHDKEDESYIFDINSALNALKNSKNKNIKDIYTRIPDEIIKNDTLDHIISILEIEDDIIQLYQYVNYVQINEHVANNLKTVTPPFIELLTKIIQTKHDIGNVYDPSCMDAQTITSLEEFEHATLYEKDENMYYHVLQNMIINEIPLEKITLHNEKVIIDESKEKYDTIISVPYLFNRNDKIFKSESTEKFKKYKTKNPNSIHLLNLIEHLDDNGVLITTTTQDLLVKNDAHELRKCLIENNLLDSVIEYETGFRSRDITILVINKNKKTDNFLFMKPEQLLPGLILPDTEEKIVESYKNREIIPKFSSIITKEEIIKNEYNLNPKRYVYTLDYEEKPIPEIMDEQDDIANQILELDKEISQLLEKLEE